MKTRHPKDFFGIDPKNFYSQKSKMGERTLNAAHGALYAKLGPQLQDLEAFKEHMGLAPKGKQWRAHLINENHVEWWHYSWVGLHPDLLALQYAPPFAPYI
jgi:hypothetical protein